MRLVVPVTTDQVRIRITGSRLEPTLAEVGLFKQSLPGAPVISARSRDGWMTITHPHPQPIVYTLDGTEPTAQSPVYRSPIALQRGGTVKAAVRTADGRLGLSESKSAVGLAPAGWKVVPPVGEETGFPAAQAIDAVAATYWKVRATTGPAPRPALTIDMGGPERIAGFAYLPRQDWSSESAVDRCRFETSLDGTTWTTQVKERHFGNIRNNPILQQVRFAPVEARFFRFTALHDLDDNGWVGAAEITVLPDE
jgi:alpha-L-fucosidase